MITKRSNHIPTLTRMDTTKSTGRLRLTRESHRSWGTTTLHVSIVQ
jgi:hypothetical protein